MSLQGEASPTLAEAGCLPSISGKGFWKNRGSLEAYTIFLGFLPSLSLSEHSLGASQGIPLTQTGCFCASVIYPQNWRLCRTCYCKTQTGAMVRCWLRSIHCKPLHSAWDAYLQDFLNAIDGGGEQRVHLEVIVDVICVPDAHVEDVSRKTGHRACQHLGLQV